MTINIVGSDGSGKTTQIKLLMPWLQERYGMSVRLITKGDVMDKVKFPQCRYFGCSYKELAEELVPKMKGESRSLFMFYLMAESICSQPPREEEISVFDGYWHKNLATEAALGVSFEWLKTVGAFFPAADVTILLQITPQEVVERNLEYNEYECGCKEISDENFISNQTKVQEFLSCLAVSENWNIVNGYGTVNEIQREIREIVSKSCELVFASD